MDKKNIVITIPEPHKVVLEERPYPRIAPGYLMVKVEIAPVCLEHQVYDEHLMEWFADPYHQGHEGVGTVCEVSPGSKFKEGDRVIMFWGNPCTECHVCRAGLSPTHCMDIPHELFTETQFPDTRLDALGGIEAQHVPGGLRGIETVCNSESGCAGMGQFRILKEVMVQKIPDELPFRIAALGNCTVGGPYTCVEECDVGPDDWVLVTGGSASCLGVVLNARYRNAKTIVLTDSEYHAKLALKIGANLVINPNDSKWLKKIHQVTGDQQGADCAIDCTGEHDYQKKALRGVKRFGTVWLYSFIVEYSKPLPIRLLDEIHARSVRLGGSQDVHVKHREGLVKMLMNPHVQEWCEHIISHEFNMSDAEEAFKLALTGKRSKIYLYPQENSPS